MLTRILSFVMVIVVLATCILPVLVAAEAATIAITAATVEGLSSAGVASVEVPIVAAVLLCAAGACGAALYISKQASNAGMTRTEWLKNKFSNLFGNDRSDFVDGISVTDDGKWVVDEDSAEMIDSAMTDIADEVEPVDTYMKVYNGTDWIDCIAVAPGTIYTFDSYTYVSNTSDVYIYFAYNTNYNVTVFSTSSSATFYWSESYGAHSTFITSTAYPDTEGVYYNDNGYLQRWTSAGLSSSDFIPYAHLGYPVDFGTGISEDYTGFGGALDYFDTSVIANRNGFMLNPDIIDFDTSTFAGSVAADRYAQAYLDWLDGTTSIDFGDAGVVELNPPAEVTQTINVFTTEEVIDEAGKTPQDYRDESKKAVEGDDAETITGDYVLDLKDIFPFCIPFDLYAIFQAFNGTAVAPSWNWSFTVYGQTYTISGDLSQFDTVAEVCRTLELLAFCVCLAIGTKNLIQGS